MKKLIPLMMCLVLSVMVFAQTGVDFRHLTFDEALAKAKAEKNWFSSIVIPLGAVRVR